MIANTWRLGTFQECRRKNKHIHYDNLVPLMPAENLIRGDAVHKGLASLFSSSDISLAMQRSEETYRARYAGQDMILPEERQMIEQGVEFSRRAIQLYHEEYPSDYFQVLHPEVEFCVPLGGTWHHCWFSHHILYPNVPYEQCISHSHVEGMNDALPCYHRHYLVGRTDAVVSWENKFWLLEHKTTSMTTEGGTKAQQNYKDTFQLDFQPTTYIYGIQRKLGIRVHGFILNLILKPSKKAKDQFAINFDRDIFVRTDQQLADYEHDLIEMCNDYERCAIEQRFYKNTRSCINFNRKCDFWRLCKECRGPQPGEFALREQDYVDLEYYKVLGIEPATEVSSANP